MLKILLSQLLILYFNLVYSQNSTFPIITYIETIQKREVDAKLYCANAKSYYVSEKGEKKTVICFYNGELMDRANSKHLDKQFEKYGLKIAFRFFDTTGNIVYINYKTDSLIERKILDQHPIIVVEPKIPKLKWIITEERKKVNDYNCIKAITDFRGGKYEAWFAPDLKIPFGPWKLNGLPGLILEAYDSTGDFSYVCKGIDYQNEISNLESFTPRLGKLVNIIEMNSEIRASKEDFINNYRKDFASKNSDPSAPTTWKSAPIKVRFQENNFEDLKK